MKILSEKNPEFSEIEFDYTNGETEKLTSLDILNYDETKFDEKVKTLKIKMIEGQYNIVKEAIDAVKKEIECNDARALEFICIEFINSPLGTTGLIKNLTKL